jgi:hypothetical protein
MLALLRGRLLLALEVLGLICMEAFLYVYAPWSIMSI